MVEELRREIGELQNYVNQICCSELKLSNVWYERMDKTSNLVLSPKGGTDSMKEEVRKFIESCKLETEMSKKRTKELNTFFTEKREKLRNLQNEKEKLWKEYEQLEKQINFSNKEMSKSKGKNLLEVELMTQACMILTGTDFEFECSYTSGYMRNDATNVLEVFSWDSNINKKMKDYLWSLMSKVYPIQLNIK